MLFVNLCVRIGFRSKPNPHQIVRAKLNEKFIAMQMKSLLQCRLLQIKTLKTVKGCNLWKKDGIIWNIILLCANFKVIKNKLFIVNPLKKTFLVIWLIFVLVTFV